MDRPWSKPYCRLSHAQRGPYQMTITEWDTYVAAYVLNRETFKVLFETSFGKGEAEAAKQALEDYVALLLPHGGD